MNKRHELSENHWYNCVWTGPWMAASLLPLQPPGHNCSELTLHETTRSHCLHRWVGFLNCEIDSDISSLTLYWNGDICLQIHNWRAVWLADLLNFNEDLYQQAFQLFEDNGLKFYKSSSSKYCVSISKFRSPPPKQWWAGQNQSPTGKYLQPTLFVILIAGLVARRGANLHPSLNWHVLDGPKFLQMFI